MTRIRQAQQLAEQIRRLRDGDFGETAKHAGIVIIGDYNPVGSRKPLEILKRGFRSLFKQQASGEIGGHRLLFDL